MSQNNNPTHWLPTLGARERISDAVETVEQGAPSGSESRGRWSGQGRSHAIFAKLTGSGSTGSGSYIGEQVRADGSSLSNGLTFDASQSGDNITGDIQLRPGMSGPRWQHPVRIERDDATWFLADAGPFPAIITGNASLATHRWKYAWSEAEFSGDSASAMTGGRSGTTSGDYAVNMVEMNHDGTYAWGVDTSGSDYPSGFAPRPVGGGGTDNTHRINVPVWMYEHVDTNGNWKYYFALMGSHDGTCS